MGSLDVPVPKGRDIDPPKLAALPAVILPPPTTAITAKPSEELTPPDSPAIATLDPKERATFRQLLTTRTQNLREALTLQMFADVTGASSLAPKPDAPPTTDDAALTAQRTLARIRELRASSAALLEDPATRALLDRYPALRRELDRANVAEIQRSIRNNVSRDTVARVHTDVQLLQALLKGDNPNVLGAFEVLNGARNDIGIVRAYFEITAGKPLNTYLDELKISAGDREKLAIILGGKPSKFDACRVLDAMQLPGGTDDERAFRRAMLRTALDVPTTRDLQAMIDAYDRLMGRRVLFDEWIARELNDDQRCSFAAWEHDVSDGNGRALVLDRWISANMTTEQQAAFNAYVTAHAGESRFQNLFTTRVRADFGEHTARWVTARLADKKDLADGIALYDAAVSDKASGSQLLSTFFQLGPERAKVINAAFQAEYGKPMLELLPTNAEQISPTMRTMLGRVMAGNMENFDRDMALCSFGLLDPSHGSILQINARDLNALFLGKDYAQRLAIVEACEEELVRRGVIQRGSSKGEAFLAYVRDHSAAAPRRLTADGDPVTVYSADRRKMWDRLLKDLVDNGATDDARVAAYVKRINTDDKRDEVMIKAARGLNGQRKVAQDQWRGAARNAASSEATYDEHCFGGTPRVDVAFFASVTRTTDRFESLARVDRNRANQMRRQYHDTCARLDAGFRTMETDLAAARVLELDGLVADLRDGDKAQDLFNRAQLQFEKTAKGLSDVDVGIRGDRIEASRGYMADLRSSNDGLGVCIQRLDKIEQYMRTAQKVLIIAGATLASGGIATPGLLGFGAGVLVGTAYGGGVSALANYSEASILIADETKSREDAMSAANTRVEEDTKDAALASLGNRAGMAVMQQLGGAPLAGVANGAKVLAPTTRTMIVSHAAGGFTTANVNFATGYLNRSDQMEETYKKEVARGNLTDEQRKELRDDLTKRYQLEGKQLAAQYAVHATVGTVGGGFGGYGQARQFIVATDGTIAGHQSLGTFMALNKWEWANAGVSGTTAVGAEVTVKALTGEEIDFTDPQMVATVVASMSSLQGSKGTFIGPRGNGGSHPTLTRTTPHEPTPIIPTRAVNTEPTPVVVTRPTVATDKPVVQPAVVPEPVAVVRPVSPEPLVVVRPITATDPKPVPVLHPDVTVPINHVDPSAQVKSGTVPLNTENQPFYLVNATNGDAASLGSVRGLRLPHNDVVTDVGGMPLPSRRGVNPDELPGLAGRLNGRTPGREEPVLVGVGGPKDDHLTAALMPPGDGKGGPAKVYSSAKEPGEPAPTGTGGEPVLTGGAGRGRPPEKPPTTAAPEPAPGPGPGGRRDTELAGLATRRTEVEALPRTNPAEERVYTARRAELERDQAKAALAHHAEDHPTPNPAQQRERDALQARVEAAEARVRTNTERAEYDAARVQARRAEDAAHADKVTEAKGLGGRRGRDALRDLNNEADARARTREVEDANLSAKRAREDLDTFRRNNPDTSADPVAAKRVTELEDGSVAAQRKSEDVAHDAKRRELQAKLDSARSDDARNAAQRKLDQHEENRLHRAAERLDQDAARLRTRNPDHETNPVVEGEHDALQQRADDARRAYLRAREENLQRQVAAEAPGSEPQVRAQRKLDEAKVQRLEFGHTAAQRRLDRETATHPRNPSDEQLGRRFTAEDNVIAARKALLEEQRAQAVRDGKPSTALDKELAALNDRAAIDARRHALREQVREDARLTLDREQKQQQKRETEEQARLAREELEAHRTDKGRALPEEPVARARRVELEEAQIRTQRAAEDAACKARKSEVELELLTAGGASKRELSNELRTLNEQERSAAMRRSQEDVERYKAQNPDHATDTDKRNILRGKEDAADKARSACLTSRRDELRAEVARLAGDPAKQAKAQHKLNQVEEQLAEHRSNVAARELERTPTDQALAVRGRAAREDYLRQREQNLEAELQSPNGKPMDQAKVRGKLERVRCELTANRMRADTELRLQQAEDALARYTRDNPNWEKSAKSRAEVEDLEAAMLQARRHRDESRHIANETAKQRTIEDLEAHLATLPPGHRNRPAVELQLSSARENLAAFQVRRAEARVERFSADHPVLPADKDHPLWVQQRTLQESEIAARQAHAEARMRKIELEASQRGLRVERGEVHGNEELNTKYQTAIRDHDRAVIDRAVLAEQQALDVAKNASARAYREKELPKKALEAFYLRHGEDRSLWRPEARRLYASIKNLETPRSQKRAEVEWCKAKVAEAEAEASLARRRIAAHGEQSEEFRARAHNKKREEDLNKKLGDLDREIERAQKELVEKARTPSIRKWAKENPLKAAALAMLGWSLFDMWMAEKAKDVLMGMMGDVFGGLNLEDSDRGYMYGAVKDENAPFDQTMYDRLVSQPAAQWRESAEELLSSRYNDVLSPKDIRELADELSNPPGKVMSQVYIKRVLEEADRRVIDGMALRERVNRLTEERRQSPVREGDYGYVDRAKAQATGDLPASNIDRK